MTWQQYRADCGYEIFNSNPRKAFRTFELTNFGKSVSWDGYVVRVNLNDEDPLSLQYHTANILIKMKISDMPEGNGADIGLSMSESNVEKYSDVLESL